MATTGKSLTKSAGCSSSNCSGVTTVQTRMPTFICKRCGKHQPNPGYKPARKT
jgi:hypothetical protein